MAEIIQILIAIIGAGGLVGAGVLTYRSARKRDSEANAITFSRDLMIRLESLEEDVKGLRQDLEKMNRVFRISMNYIERFLQWAKAGSNPPIPTIPESLREHLDPSLITEHARQQQESTGPPDADPKASRVSPSS